MRKLKTKPFGEIEVDEAQELLFLNGLFGFENYKKYYILEDPESAFVWLQSSEDPGLAFIMIQPLQFKAEYKLNISQEDLNDIKIKEKDKELMDFAIVTIPEDPSKMTANLPQGCMVLLPAACDLTKHRTLVRTSKPRVHSRCASSHN